MLTRLSKYLFTITVFGLAPFTAMAAEPPQAILSDLVRSRPSVTNSNDRTPSLLKELAGPSLSITAATELYDGSRREETEELFALDELGIRQDDAELAIPEDLPVSDIPLTMNSKVEYFVNYFQTRGKASFSKWLSRSSRYIPMMKALLKREGMPEDLVYLAMIESGFQLNARSWASAVGPWQFMSGSGKRYALRIDL
jgi:membrane-bound lytic murein transglycosylase D